MNKFKPKFHARRRPLRIAPNSAILLEVIPMCNEKPEIQASELLRSNSPAPVNLGLPYELPSVFNFIKGSSGAFHFIILGIPILIFFAGKLKRKIL